LPLTRKVGHEGHFIAEKSTVDTLKRSWRPKLTDVNPYAVWAKEGSKSILERAHEEAERLFSSDVHERLPSDVGRRIDEILKGTEKKSE